MVKPATWICAAMAAALSMGVQFDSAVAAEKAAVENAQVAKYLTDAKKLAVKKQWVAALAEVERARGVPTKSAYTDYKINEFAAYLLTQQKKYREAAAVFEQIVDLRQAPAESAGHLKTAAQLYFQAQQYPKVIEVSGRALKDAPRDQVLLELAGQARYLTKDFRGAATTLQQLVTITEQSGRQPKEGWLQTLLNSYDQLGNAEAVAATWEALLRHYPKLDYWQAVLNLRAAGKQPEEIEHGYQRLKFDLGLLKNPADFEDLALSALDAGIPGEAVRAVESVLEQRILVGAAEARFRRMLAHAQRESAKSRSALPQLVADAQKARTGQLSVALGQAYLGYQQYDAAVAALRQGLKQGSLRNPDQSRIELGIALLKSNQRQQARATFASIDAASKWSALARLWSLRAAG